MAMPLTGEMGSSRQGLQLGRDIKGKTEHNPDGNATGKENAAMAQSTDGDVNFSRENIQTRS
jgi:hypothetical protein